MHLRLAFRHESESSTDAFLCAQLLREQGISAEIRDGEISGLAGVRHHPLTFGIATLYVGEK